MEQMAYPKVKVLEQLERCMQILSFSCLDGFKKATCRDMDHSNGQMVILGSKNFVFA